jgi:hypothetical protein
LQDHLEGKASAAPDGIVHVFRIVGKNVSWTAVDDRRRTSRGRSKRQLADLYKRRNQIAHRADRVGSGRAHLAIDEAESYVVNTTEIIVALDRLT